MLVALLTSRSNFIPALLLHAQAERTLGEASDTKSEHAQTYFANAAAYLARAVIAAENASMPAMALECYANELYDRLRAGEAQFVKERATMKLDQKRSELPERAKLRFIWLQHVADYQLAERSDKRQQIAAVFDAALGDHSELCADLIIRMKRGEAIDLLSTVSEEQ